MRLSIGLITLALAGSALAMPLERRDAVQDVGNALKAGSDAIGLTEAHNIADAYTGGAIKAFENDSGLTEASEGVGIQPYGLPITKRQTLSGSLSGSATASLDGNMADINSFANQIQSEFDALVNTLQGEFDQFTNAGNAGLPDPSSIIASYLNADAVAQKIETKFRDLENKLIAAFQTLAGASNVDLPTLSGDGLGALSGAATTGSDGSSGTVSASTSNTAAAASS